MTPKEADRYFQVARELRALLVSKMVKRPLVFERYVRAPLHDDRPYVVELVIVPGFPDLLQLYHIADLDAVMRGLVVENLRHSSRDLGSDGSTEGNIVQALDDLVGEARLRWRDFPC
jgi:hypothetical protein